MWHSILAISLGSSLGALLRWFFSVKFNDYYPDIPLGTLLSNVIGGYIIGLAIAYFSQTQDLAPEWRLLIVTGFCGGLTTFSTFSVEVLTLMQQGRISMAMGVIAIHVTASLWMSYVGMITWQWWKLR